MRVQGPGGAGTIPFADFHRLPGETPHIDTNLKPDELITAIDLPPSPYANHCHSQKIRDRASYEFALVSVAAALEIRAGTIHSARVALGGVAHKPWRAQRAEQALVGQQPRPEAFESAARIALEKARPYPGNSFKVPLAERAIARALSAAVGDAA